MSVDERDKDRKVLSRESPEKRGCKAVSELADES